MMKHLIKNKLKKSNILEFLFLIVIVFIKSQGKIFQLLAFSLNKEFLYKKKKSDENRMTVMI